MLILIAESKTMAPCCRDIPAAKLQHHTPLFEAEAAAIMRSLDDFDNAELCRKIKISQAMVANLRRMAYEFPNKSTGIQAIEAFTGVVFKAFDYPALTSDGQRRCCDSVRIISSVYGWLRPDDIIKDYRMDFATRLAPDGGSMNGWWRGRVTEQLFAELRDSGCRDILDLMPADAAKCIDRKQLPPDIRVWKAVFRSVDGPAVHTPHAGRLKTLRGLLLRQIISEGINAPAGLLTLSTPDYMAEPEPEGDSIIFTTA